MSYSNELYQQVILDHNKNPRNFKELEEHSHFCPGNNPLCGDKINVYLQIDEGKISDVSFKGSGCAISKASASMMTEAVKGKGVEEAKVLITEFKNMLSGDLEPDNSEHHLGKLVLFKGVREYSSRVKCASLAWYTLQGAMDMQTEITTE